jgi:hypothetical protein
VGVPGRNGKPHWIRIEGGGSALLETARPGDAIALYSWRDRVRYVVTGDTTYVTGASALHAWRLPLAWSLGLFAAGLSVLAAGLWWLRHGAARVRRSPWQVSALAGPGVLTGLSLGPWVAHAPSTVGTALQVAAVCSALALFAVLLTWTIGTVRERRRGARSACATEAEAARAAEIEVACAPEGGPPPRTHRVLRITLPYERAYAGYDHLVIAPEGLAMSPDPAGHFGNRPLPADLTLLRVRHQLRTDPPHCLTGHHPPAEHRVAECVTGTRTLLFFGPLRELKYLAAALTRKR